MPNYDETKAGVQDDQVSCGAQDALSHWMRIPEAWAALSGLPHADAEGIRSPYDLAAFCAAGRALPFHSPLGMTLSLWTGRRPPTSATS
jgi:hypothetical protein